MYMQIARSRSANDEVAGESSDKSGISVSTDEFYKNRYNKWENQPNTQSTFSKSENLVCH